MSSSTEQPKDGRTWLNLPLVSRALRRTQLYQDCSLPLDRFIRCEVHKDYSALIISGKPGAEQLQAAWNRIYSEFVDINHENDDVYILNLQREIVLMDDHISQASRSLYFLYTLITMNATGTPQWDGCRKILRSHGYRYQLSTENMELCMAELKQVEGRLAMKRLNLAGKEGEYNAFVKGAKGAEVTDHTYTKILVRLAKFQGVAVIRPKDITVREYVAIFKDYLETGKQKNSDDGREQA